MSEVIAVIGPKGGIGKTTLSLNLGVAFARRNRSVLLIDADAQGAIQLYLDRGEISGLSDYLMDRVTINQAIKRTREDGLKVLPRGRLSPLDHANYEGALARTPALQEVVDLVAPRFDLVLVDTPSGLGGVTRATLEVATHALVPIQAEPMATRAMSATIELIQSVRSSTNPNLDLLGLVPMMVDVETPPSPEEQDALWMGAASGLDVGMPRRREFIDASHQRQPLHRVKPPLTELTARLDSLAQLIEDALWNAQDETASRIERIQRRLDAMEAPTETPRFHSFVADSPAASSETQTLDPEELDRQRNRILAQLCERESFGFWAWNELLDWCLRMTGARHAVVVDQHGLAVASTGELSTEVVEASGSRLVSAFEQANRMQLSDGRAQSISIQVGESWLTGMRVDHGDDAAFVLGIVGEQPLQSELRHLLEDVLGIVIQQYYEASGVS